MAKKAAVKEAAIDNLDNKNGEELVAANLDSLTKLVGSLSETLELLVQKTENMACHLIATEEVLAEVVSVTGVDLARVNARIRTKIVNGTDGMGSPDKTIDIAASIVAPKFKVK